MRWRDWEWRSVFIEVEYWSVLCFELTNPYLNISLQSSYSCSINLPYALFLFAPIIMESLISKEVFMMRSVGVVEIITSR